MALNVKWERYDLIRLLSSVEGTVIHNDIDGLLSGLYIYQQFNIPIVGICELGTNDQDIGCLSINEKFNIEDPDVFDKILFLDCGVAFEKAKVIDHHTMPEKYYNKRKINYCKYFSKDNSIQNKCPVGNILWLMAIHNEDFRKYNELQQKLIISADGTHMNYFNYPNNTQYAIDCLGLNDLIPTIKQMGKNRCNIIDSLLGMNNDPFFRCARNFKNGLGKTIDEIAFEINKIMNWKGNPFIDGKNNRIKLITHCWNSKTHPEHLDPHKALKNTFTHTICKKDESRSTVIEICNECLQNNMVEMQKVQDSSQEIRKDELNKSLEIKKQNVIEIDESLEVKKQDESLEVKKQNMTEDELFEYEFDKFMADLSKFSDDFLLKIKRR